MPEEQQEQELERPEYKNQTITSEAADILKVLFDKISEEKREVILRLNGWIEKTKINDRGEIEVYWEYDEKAKIANEAGRQRIMIMLNACFSSDKILTSIDKNDVGNLTVNIGEEAIKQFELNAKEFGLSNSDWTLIAGWIAQKQYLSLKAAENGGIRNFLKIIYKVNQQEQIIHQRTQDTKRGGLFGWFGRRN